MVLDALAATPPAADAVAQASAFLFDRLRDRRSDAATQRANTEDRGRSVGAA
jgi:hypothetical protein